MKPASPILSLILCSRNDAYMGNSRWRLETTLNYTAARVAALGLESEVEIIVSDWGSEVPLADVVALEPAAAPIVSFLQITPETARALQQDSPFPEVLALNAAARRARGQYIGRIDQDTLVGERFLRWMIDAAASSKDMLLFANRRSIPYRFAVLCPRLAVVDRFVRAFRHRLRIETGRVFYHLDVGVWLAHRDVWSACGGYDERMIYMNDMDVDMVDRLRSTYALVDLGPLVEWDFYHLDHYHPGGSRSSSTHRTVNSQHPLRSIGFRPSGDAWGLADQSLHLSPATRPPRKRTGGGAVVFVALALHAGVRLCVDWVLYPFCPVWKRRARLAWAAVHREPIVRWPSLLRKLWLERPSARGIVHS